MPTVDGKEYAYTPAGQRAAAAARKAKGNPGASVPKPRPMGSRPAPRRAPARAPRARGGVPPVARAPRTPRTKGDLSGKGYNIARNINGGKLPDLGY